MREAAEKPLVSARARGLRWRWILFSGILVAFATYVVGLFVVSVGVDVLSFLVKQEWVSAGREAYSNLGRIISHVIWPLLYVALVVGAALWVGRRVLRAALVHGLLIGVTSAGFWHLIGLLFGTPDPWELVTYPLLGLAGGCLGGLRGWAARAGEEALYDTSRAVSAAQTPREIAAAIGENLAGSKVSGITLWEQTTENSKEEFLLIGFWSPRAGRDWPPGARLDSSRITTLVESEGHEPLELRTEDLEGPEGEAWNEEDAKSLLLIPLVPPGGASRALLAVASRKARGFPQSAIRSYLTTSGPAALALENVRLLDRARKTGRKAGMLGERQRLAREIHDTLAQGFTSIVMNLEAAEGALPEEVPEKGRTKWHLDQAKLTARDSLTEARRFVWALRPESLENASLPEALEGVAARWSDAAGLEATANVTGTPRQISAEAEVTMVRVAQEALANILKHAGASRVMMTLSYMNDLVALDVMDDGSGFDPDSERADTPEGGFGLKTMRERIEQLGGRLIIQSAPEEGTTLVAELPLAATRSAPLITETP